MLERIRESTKGWFAWLVVGTLAVVFALWGVYGYMGVNSAESQMAVTVNGRDISRAAVERLSQQLQLTASASGETGTPESYREEALEQLIMQTLLVQDAKKHKFVADKQLVDKFLLTQPEFQENGVFSPALFEEIAQRNGLDPYDLRSIIADEIIVEQLRVGVMASAFTLPNEVKRFLALQNQTRDIQFITFSSKSFDANRDISEDEVKAYYESNQQNFQMPEEVSIEYIELTAADAAKGVTITNADVQAYYDQNKASYTTAEQRHVRHILLALPADATVEQTNKVIDQGVQIINKIKAGGNFSALALEYSTDTSTADKGGDLGWMLAGVLPAELDKSVFAVKQNEVIGPTLTPYGIDIAQVVGIKPVQTQALSAVSGAIMQQLKDQRVQQQFIEMQDELATLSYEIPDSLKEVSDTLQLPIKTTEFFTRDKGGNDTITQSANVRTEAFSDAVLNGENSPVLSIGPEHVIVLRMHEHKAAQIKPLDSVRAGIVYMIKTVEAQEKLQAALDAWVPELSNGTLTRDEVAKRLNGQWLSSAKLARTPSDNGVPRLVHDYAFNMQKPVPPKASYGWLPMDGNQFAIVAVDQVNQGAVGDEKSTDWVGATTGLKMLQQQESYMVYLEQLRKNADIKYH